MVIDVPGMIGYTVYTVGKEARKLRRYAVEVTAEAAVKYYYIMNNDTLEVEILPTRYLTHKTRSNRSPNTVKRSAYSLCYYMEYMAGKEMELLKVYELTYEEQNLHFIQEDTRNKTAYGMQTIEPVTLTWKKCSGSIFLSRMSIQSCRA
jgi:hypothetical protein